MFRLTIVFAGLFGLAACGNAYQQTPEPHETDRINRLVEELGTQRSYNSRTLITNPEPDGRVLMRWIDRRRATLAKTLPLGQLPALTNPGSISDTLAWERETSKAEAGVGNSLTHYMLDFETRRATCPQSAGAEAQWFDSERQAYANGLRDRVVDWRAVSARYQAQCDIEGQQISARADAAQRTVAEARTQLVQGERECRALGEAAEQAYQDAPSIETGHALTIAQQRVGECLSGFEEQRRIVDEADSRL